MKNKVERVLLAMAFIASSTSFSRAVRVDVGIDRQTAEALDKIHTAIERQRERQKERQAVERSLADKDAERQKERTERQKEGEAFRRFLTDNAFMEEALCFAPSVYVLEVGARCENSGRRDGCVVIRVRNADSAPRLTVSVFDGVMTETTTVWDVHDIHEFFVETEGFAKVAGMIGDIEKRVGKAPRRSSRFSRPDCEPRFLE